MKTFYLLVIVLTLLVSILPVWVMVTGAFSDWRATFLERITLRALSLRSVRLIWTTDSLTKILIPLVSKWFRNSIVYCTLAAVLSSVVSTAAGYALARFQFPGRRYMNSLVVLAMIIPGLAMYIPDFLVMVKLHLMNPFGFVITSVASAGGILYARQYAHGLSHEVFEAARVDGASEMQIFRHIAVPMLMPIVLMQFSAVFVGLWTNLMWANIMLRGQGQWTLAQGIVFMLHNIPAPTHEDGMAIYSFVMLISAIPPAIVYLLAQKSIVKGIEGLVQE